MEKRDCADSNLFSVQQMTQFHVISDVLQGRVSAGDAAEVLGLSRRHVFRLKKAIGQAGPEGLIHGNKDRKPCNRIDAKKKKRVLEIFDPWKHRTDLGLNAAHLQDVLHQHHAIEISRQTLWRWLRETGRRMPQRVWKKHRKARERSGSEGEILFLDGSEHPWFGKAYPSATLILCSDDATSKALYGVFVEQENLMGCFEVAYHVFSRYGLPRTYYLDRASQFKTTRKKYDGTLHPAPPTHWQEAMAAFGVRCIFAYSPQARGRGERMNGTFQGRLASELQYHRINDLPEATRYLNDVFIPAYNSKFAVQSRDLALWRPSPTEDLLKANLAVREKRLVDNDNTFWFKGKKYQILPHPKAFHVVRSQVEVRKTFDGTVSIVHRKYGLLSHQIIKLRKKHTPRNIYKPRGG